MLTGACPGWRLQLASCYEGKNVRAMPDQWVRVRVRAGTLGGEWWQVRWSCASINAVVLAVPYRAPTTLCAPISDLSFLLGSYRERAA